VIKKSSKTDKTAINPAQLETAYKRSFTLIGGKRPTGVLLYIEKDGLKGSEMG
jgi:hypothetical protein